MTANKIVKWYQQNKRDLPWRSTVDPYRIWLSEIILQQTRVDQGLSYYLKFCERFPTIKDLAEADLDDVLRLWQGLGYYSRARNLHHSAQMILNEFNGTFPDQYEDIKSLKGVGDYVAAAIGSFAFGIKKPVLDGNVFRVISRFYGIHDPIDVGSSRKIFLERLEQLISDQDPAEFNQSIMEFGALMCTPKNPQCESCPVKSNCASFKNDWQSLLPIKSKKIKKRDRFLYFMVVKSDDGYILEKRGKKDIWAEMYQFPVIESEKELHWKDIENDAKFKLLAKDGITFQSVLEKHLLTHQNIFYSFLIAKSNLKGESTSYKSYSINEIEDLPFPKIIGEYLEKKLLHDYKY